jgi:hypothetical protein
MSGDASPKGDPAALPKGDRADVSRPPPSDCGQRARARRSGPETLPLLFAVALSAATGVASGLRILRGLGYAANFGGRNSRSPTFIWGRTHAVAGHIAGWRRRWKLSGATHGQRAARRFNMSGPRIQLAYAVDFLAHSFECCSEHLFALQGMFRCAGKASASWRSFPARGPANLTRERAFLIAHVTETLSQRLKVVRSGIVDFGMVTAHDEFMFIVAENAALEFAGYGHGQSQLWRSRRAPRRDLGMHLEADLGFGAGEQLGKAGGSGSITVAEGASIRLRRC